MYHVNTKQKKTGLVVLISVKVNLITRKIIRDKNDYNIMKEAILPEDMRILYVDLPNNTS
jgi:hypothetical protein